jgi:hypothetical protein
MVACPRCSGETNLVEGRKEWWCNRCLQFVPTAGPPAVGAEADAPSKRQDEKLAAAAVEVVAGISSLVIVVPILLLTVLVCAVLVWLGLREVAGVVAVAGVALAFLFRWTF